MGYESRVFIVEEHDTMKWSDVIAVVNMCKMGPGFKGIFTQPVTNYFYAPNDGNARVKEDAYGEEIKAADIQTVIYFLEKEVKRGEDYRRIKPLLSLLKSFETAKWTNLKVYHYGY